MWAHSSSALKPDATGETGRGATSEHQPSGNGNTSLGVQSSSAGVRRFRWSPDAVRRLDEDIEWALTSNPTGTAEVAGVLLGSIGPISEITDCQPVLLMQPKDHAYALAGPGRSEFERAIAAFPSVPEGQRSVIGFYRSQTGDALDLTEDDLGLARACFRNSSPVVLLIQRTANGSSSANLFSGDQGEVLHQFHFLEDASALENKLALPRWLELWQSLSAEDPPDMVGQETATPEDTTVSTRTLRPPDPVLESTPILATGKAQENFDPLEKASNRSPVFLVATALVVAILTGYLMLRGSARVKQEVGIGRPAIQGTKSGGSHTAGLALRAERHGDDVRLDWDRTSPVLAAATGGLLSIRDGKGREKQVMLDGNLLRTGSVIYRPVHGDVFLRLVIFGQQGAKLDESVSSYPQHMR